MFKLNSILKINFSFNIKLITSKKLEKEFKHKKSLINICQVSGSSDNASNPAYSDHGDKKLFRFRPIKRARNKESKINKPSKSTILARCFLRRVE